MKKIILIIVGTLLSISAFAQIEGFHNPVPSRNMYAKHKIVIKEPVRHDVPNYASPSTGLAEAVAITGIVATGLRGVEELAKPAVSAVIVLPPEIDPKEVVIEEMDPVVKHPVPISIVPLPVTQTN